MEEKSYEEIMAYKIKQVSTDEQCTFKPTVNRTSQQICDQRSCSSVNPFESLYQNAEEKKVKTRLVEEQHLKEAKDNANRSKIDINSQKMILKKKERALQALLEKCLTQEASDQLAAKGVMDFLTLTGIFKDDDEATSKNHSFTEKRQSVQRLLTEQTIFNDLWKLLTLHNDSAATVPSNFLFDIVIILLETQLTPPSVIYIVKLFIKAVELILDQIKVQLKKFILQDYKSDEDQRVDEECLSECILNLKPTVQAFICDFRQIYESRKNIIDKKLGLKMEKSESKESEFFSFKPNICEKSKEILAKASTQTQGENRYEQLFEHSKFLAQKKKTQAEESHQKKMNEPGCSFKPKINEPKFQLTQENAHQRLYQFAQKITEHKEQLREYYVSKKEQCEMEECTFKPQTCDLLRTKPVNRVKGEEQVIERLSKARKIREDKENYYTSKEQQFKKHDSTKITYPQPFNLNSRTSNCDNKKVFLYIDVKISKNKKVRIGLKEGDDPREVAENFGKIHQLNQELKATLEETLQEYMQYFEEAK